MTVTINGNGQISGTYMGPMGQCVLELAGLAGPLQLNRKDGSFLFINGVFQQIPSPGPTLAPTGLGINNYYIYASMSSGVMILSADTTAPVTDPTYGHKIKSGTGGNAFSLVGQARMRLPAVWEDNDSLHFVLSWYNKKSKFAQQPFTNSFTAVNNGSGVWTGLGPVLPFISWGGEPAAVRIEGFGAPAVGAFCCLSLGIDGVTNTPIDPSTLIQAAASGSAFNYAFNLGTTIAFPTDGLHSLQLITSSQSGSTNIAGFATIGGSSNGRTYMNVTTQG